MNSMSPMSSVRRWSGRNTRTALVLLSMCAVLAVAVVARNMATDSFGFPQEASAASPDLERIDRELAGWREAAKVDSFSAIAPAYAAALLMQRARLTGSANDAMRAEAEARRSLALRTQHNGGAFVCLLYTSPSPRDS